MSFLILPLNNSPCKRNCQPSGYNPGQRLVLNVPNGIQLLDGAPMSRDGQPSVSTYGRGTFPVRALAKVR